MLFVEIKTLNLSFNPVATWHVTCVSNLTFAHVTIILNETGLYDSMIIQSTRQLITTNCISTKF
jgi:hypothetical protein